MKKRRDEEVEDLTEKQISWWFQELLKTLKTHTHTHTKHCAKSKAAKYSSTDRQRQVRERKRD